LAAIDAEAQRRIVEQQKSELARAGAAIEAPVPATLAMLLAEFFRAHACEHLAPKTIERYRDMVAACLSPELITPLLLSRAWARLLREGGHVRKTKSPRPLSGKTVRNIAGVVSSAFSRAIKWGLTAANPVTNSELPKVKRHRGVALTPAQQWMLIDAATSPWCLKTYLEVVAATGCRRGELLALRWSDIQDSRALIGRSLTQTRDVLEFKDTKSDVDLPPFLTQTVKAQIHLKEN
jgi:integrase